MATWTRRLGATAGVVLASGAVSAQAAAPPAAAPPAAVPFRVEGALRLDGRQLVGHVVATGAARISIRIRPTSGRTALFTGDRSVRIGDTTIHLALSRDAVRRLRHLTRRAVDVRLTGQGPLAGQTYDAPAVAVTF